jgi:hypothetical protein
MHKIAPQLMLATTTAATPGYHHLIASASLAAAAYRVPGLGALLLLILAVLFIGALSSAASAARGLALLLSVLLRGVGRLGHVHRRDCSRHCSRVFAAPLTTGLQSFDETA